MTREKVNPTAAMLVIGDEILSGRTRDSNMYHLAGTLCDHGIDLREVRMVPDTSDAIIDAVKTLSISYDFVFTSGGIGPTHDDITADSVAAALGVKIDLHADAFSLLEAHYKAAGKEFNASRQRMARIPDGARLIENPISVAPGFQLKNVYVMAGVPSVFQAMVENILPDLSGGAPLITKSCRFEIGEGDLAGPLGDLAQSFPQLSIGSYPFTEGTLHGSNIVIRGQNNALIDRAFSDLRSRLI